MSISIGSLAIKLSANAQDFNTALDRVKGNLKSFASSAGSALSGVAGSLGIGIGIAAAVAGYHSLTEQINSTADAAARLGTRYETLEKLQFAGGLSGVDSESMTGLLSKVNRQIGALQSGSADAVKDFAQLGLKANDFKGLELDNSLLLIVERLSGIEDPAVRAAAAFALLGKQADAALNLAADGAGKVREAMQSHGTWALSDDQAALVKAMSDQEAGVGDMLKNGFKQTVWLLNASKMGLQELWAGMAFGGEEDPFDVLMRTQALADEQRRLAESHREANAAAAQTALAQAKAQEDAGKAVAEMTARLKEQMAISGANMSPEHAAIFQLANKHEISSEQMRQLNDLAWRAQKQAEEKKLMEEQARKLEGLQEKGKALTLSLDPTAKIISRVAELNAMVDAGAISWEIYAKAIEQAADEAYKLDEALAPAMSFGSAAAGTAINRWAQKPGAGENMGNKLLQKTADLQAKTNAILARIERNTDKPVPRPVNIR